MILNRESVKNYLPHRDPFLFVDSVASFEKRGSICATFELKPELPFFKGHFPNMPILPGVIAVEALAQASGLLLALKADSEPGNKMFFLASNNIKFVSVARAGETLELKSRLEREYGGLCRFSVEALSEQRLVASGVLVLVSAENVAI